MLTCNAFAVKIANVSVDRNSLVELKLSHTHAPEPTAAYLVAFA